MSKQRADVTELLSVVSGGFAVVLGGVMLIGALGVMYAIATSTHVPLQFADAAVLTGAGAINAWAGRQFLKRRLQVLMTSAVATATLMAYLAAIGDLGEPFLFHLVYLALLATLAYSGRSVQAVA